MNRKDLCALTLVGPTQDNLLLDPIDVLHLDNQLSAYWEINSFKSQMFYSCWKFKQSEKLKVQWFQLSVDVETTFKTFKKS